MTIGNTISRVITLVVVILIGLFLNWLFTPAWSFCSGGFWWFMIVMTLIGSGCFAISEYFWADEELVVSKILICATGLIVVFAIIGLCCSGELFNAGRYQKLATIEEGNFEQDISAANNIEDIIVVDMPTAQKVGDRTLGNLENSTWFEVDDEYNVIKYNGTYYRISAINYGGFFKWIRAKEQGLPGYVLVNAITQEATLVKLKDGMRYSPSAYFEYDLKRALRSKYSSYVFDKSFFEIDEEGTPYWITGIKTSNIGFWGGKRINSFIITNAITGECTEYSKDSLPEWVDHAYSLDYLMDIAEFNLKYVNGYLNTWFSKTGVRYTSYSYRNSETNFKGYNTTIKSDGSIVFYTGVTPANVAESNLGFLLLSPRTGEIKYYDCVGAEESSAQNAAEGLVQNLGYVATFPTIINVDGIETYFMALKDGAGLIQRYSLCRVSNYTQVVESPTLQGALQLYLQKIGMEPVSNNKEAYETEGKIASLYQAEIDGYTWYFFTIEGKEELYMSSITNSAKQVLLGIGTNVKLKYTASSEAGVFTVIEINF